jgi:hypothetical protein
MLNIRIKKVTGTAPNYVLELDGNGVNRGHSTAYERMEDVQWEVLGTTPIERISGIIWKNISGSTNIFPTSGEGSPQPVGNGRVWKAKVNVTQEVVYVYSIKFIIGGSEYTYDPIISINPSTGFFKELAAPLLGAAVGVLATFLFANIYGKKWKSRK